MQQKRCVEQNSTPHNRLGADSRIPPGAEREGIITAWRKHVAENISEWVFERRAASPPHVPASQHKQARSWDSKNGQSEIRCSWLHD